MLFISQTSSTSDIGFILVPAIWADVDDQHLSNCANGGAATFGVRKDSRVLRKVDFGRFHS